MRLDSIVLNWIKSLIYHVALTCALQLHKNSYSQKTKVAKAKDGDKMDGWLLPNQHTVHTASHDAKYKGDECDEV